MKQLPLGDVKTVTNLGIEIHVGLPVGRATRFRGERGRGERAGSRGASGGCEPPGRTTGGFTPPARREFYRGVHTPRSPRMSYCITGYASLASFAKFPRRSRWSSEDKLLWHR